MFTTLIKHESEECNDCGRPQEGYFGSPYVQNLSGCYKGQRKVHLWPLCKICFETAAACSEAEFQDRRFSKVGVGIEEIKSPEGERCPCGAVTHARLKMCIQCSKDARMLKKIQAEKKFIDKLLKNLRAEIKSKVKEIENAN